MLTTSSHRGAKPSDICYILDHANVTKAILTPWIMEDIARRPDAQRYIEPFEKVMYGTAVLSSYAADTWSRWTDIQNIWGMTETLGPAQLEQDPDDHSYVTLDMVHSGITFKDTKTTEFIDGRHSPLYELVFTMTPDSVKFGGVGTAPHHARMGIPPEAVGKEGTPEYPTGDLWTPHPDPAKAAYVWRFAGRSDDLITFSSGINVHPGPLERAITSNEFVRAALIIGNMHQQPLALVVSTVDVVCKSKMGKVINSHGDYRNLPKVSPRILPRPRISGQTSFPLLMSRCPATAALPKLMSWLFRVEVLCGRPKAASIEREQLANFLTKLTMCTRRMEIASRTASRGRVGFCDKSV